MKKIIKYICCIIFLCIFALLIYFGYKAYKVIFTPQSYTITVDTRLTHLAYQQIDSFIQQEIKYQEEDSKIIAAQLKAKFPFIESINIARLANQSLKIDLYSYRPLFIVNKNLTLLESGILAEKDTFNDKSIELLPSVTVNESVCTNSRLEKSCYDCITTASQNIFEKYKLSWGNCWEIMLSDKKQQRFSVVCDSRSIMNEKKLQLCSLLKDELQQRKEFLYNRQKKWDIDIRFDNQIIIFSRGGKDHGYNAST